jgi:hypothetical protein
MFGYGGRSRKYGIPTGYAIIKEEKEEEAIRALLEKFATKAGQSR